MKNEELAAAQLYADIIDLPHYEPKHHPRMSMWNRASQFAPFAALTGYDAAIKETAQDNADNYDAKNCNETEP